MHLPALFFRPVILSALSINGVALAHSGEDLNYPDAPRRVVTDEYHGVSVDDPFRWMEDHRSNEVRAWAKSQASLTDRHFESLTSRELIEPILGEYMSITRPPAPMKYGDRYFFVQRRGDQKTGVLYAQDRLDGEPYPVIDPNPHSEDGSIGLSTWVASEGGRYVFYALTDGSAWQPLRIRDVKTGEDLPETLEGIHRLRLTAAWDYADEGFFYTWVEADDPATATGADLKNLRVMYHRLGTPQSDDRLIWTQPDRPDFLYYGLWVNTDNRHLIITGRDGRGQDRGVYFMDLTDPAGEIREIIGPDEAFFGYINGSDHTILMRTNLDAANHRLISIDLRHPERSAWKTVVDETENPLQAAVVLGDRILATYQEHAEQVIRVFDPGGEHVGDLRAVERGGILVALSRRVDGDYIYATSTGASDPGSRYRVDLRTCEMTLHQPLAGLAWDPTDYETTKVFVTSADGTRIPTFLSHRKDIELDGSNPALLSAFAAFGFNARPTFSAFNMYWMQLGGVVVMPQIRGGSTYGPAWATAGRGVNKPNTIDDFLATAHWLIDEGYTSPKKLVITSSSGGGIISASAVARFPELFAAALVDYAMTDLYRYEVDDAGTSMPNEYGSVEDSAVFAALQTYSPYHNIKRDASFPAILISCGEFDVSTPVWHSYKFAAALQANQQGDQAVLLRLEYGGQHFPRGQDNTRAWFTDQMAFVLDAMDLEPFVRLSSAGRLIPNKK